MASGVGPAYLSPLLGVQEAAPAVNRQQPVLGKEEWVVFAQPLPLVLYVGQVIGIMIGDVLPVVAEVASLAVFSFQFQVGLLYLLEEVGVDTISIVGTRPLIDILSPSIN